MNKIKYPKDIASVIRKQTLSVTAELVKPNLELGESPLKFYNETFSRFPFTIINEQKKFANANISVKEIPNIFKRSQKAYDTDIDLALRPQVLTGSDETKNNEDSKAYTVQITSGFFKGKTPAQVLMENPNNLDGLRKQFEWLKSNLERYPNNKTQMLAIYQAQELFQSGKLSQEKSQDTVQGATLPPFVIYNSGFRPKTRKTREDGKSFVYSIKISWNFGNNYPVEIEIYNYYAPVVKSNNGLLNVQFAQRDKKSEIKNIMKLSAAEWENILYIMKVNMRAYENEVGKELRKASADASYQNSQNG